MFINKIGKHHLELGENCQDFGKFVDYTNNNKYSNEEEIYLQHKLVCDGCSEGKHSEVGAKLYTLLNESPITELNYTMDNIIRLLSISDKFNSLFCTFENIKTNPQIIKDYCCFTILDCWNIKSLDNNPDYDVFVVHYCGDGYIITQDHEDNIDFIKIDDGEYPKYLAYNYITDKSKLKYYKEGVDFTREIFRKDQYKNVGVASDGIRYILDCDDEELKQEFISILKDQKEVKMKRFINKHQSLFKDDITISF